LFSRSSRGLVWHSLWYPYRVQPHWVRKELTITVFNRQTRGMMGRLDPTVRSGGFSMLEMLVVIMIVGILVTMVTQAFGPVQNRLSTRSARQALLQLKSVARTRAVERGSMASLVVDVGQNMAYVRQDATVITSFYFMTELGVTVTSPADSIVLCMSPRGYANLDCNSFVTATGVTFTAGSSTRSVRINPMGQIK
jgi:prepilin-type N-terminal cleavage/methylation domain-containing protein